MTRTRLQWTEAPLVCRVDVTVFIEDLPSLDDAVRTVVEALEETTLVERYVTVTTAVELPEGED